MCVSIRSECYAAFSPALLLPPPPPPPLPNLQVITTEDTIAIGLNYVELENLPVTLLYCADDAHPSHALAVVLRDKPNFRHVGCRYCICCRVSFFGLTA
jgi:hypothetical protein